MGLFINAIKVAINNPIDSSYKLLPIIKTTIYSLFETRQSIRFLLLELIIYMRLG